jgi:hypothetical protein
MFFFSERCSQEAIWTELQDLLFWRSLQIMYQIWILLRKYLIHRKLSVSEKYLRKPLFNSSKCSWSSTTHQHRGLHLTWAWSHKGMEGNQITQRKVFTLLLQFQTDRGLVVLNVVIAAYFKAELSLFVRMCKSISNVSYLYIYFQSCMRSRSLRLLFRTSLKFL